ncbi:hypothetical protein Nos7107_0839 [Nostoc sp. PCC 7107]|nr:hypothetical protein Nos7107_0839 [Nostoc sp. PCC 7107]
MNDELRILSDELWENYPQYSVFSIHLWLEGILRFACYFDHNFYGL